MSPIILEGLEILPRAIKYGWNVVRNPSCYEYFGIRIPLSATAELDRIRKRVYLGLYERDEIRAVRRLLQPHDVVVEIGAGCGVVSAAISRQLANSRNLHSYEANPRLLPSIQAVAAANGVEPVITMAAVGRSSGKAEFFVCEDFLSSSLVERKGNYAKDVVGVVGFEELMDRLKPTFLMMDVEGAEKDLLTGPIPDCVRTIVVELHPHIVGDHCVSVIIRNLITLRFHLLLDMSRERVAVFTRPV